MEKAADDEGAMISLIKHRFISGIIPYQNVFVKFNSKRRNGNFPAGQPSRTLDFAPETSGASLKATGSLGDFHDRIQSLGAGLRALLLVLAVKKAE